jgi:hypothetical protein
MKCPCIYCIVDIMCKQACEELISYIIYHDKNDKKRLRRLPEDLPKSRRLAKRIGRAPAYIVSHETCILLRDHFNNFIY